MNPPTPFCFVTVLFVWQSPGPVDSILCTVYEGEMVDSNPCLVTIASIEFIEMGEYRQLVTLNGHDCQDGHPHTLGGTKSIFGPVISFPSV